MRTQFSFPEFTLINSGGNATPFWGDFDNGQNFFIIESNPVFQRATDSAVRQDVRSVDRAADTLFDPNRRYSNVVFEQYVVNPPAIYDKFTNLVLPNNYLDVFANGDVVMIRSAICV